MTKKNLQGLKFFEPENIKALEGFEK